MNLLPNRIRRSRAYRRLRIFSHRHRPALGVFSVLGLAFFLWLLGVWQSLERRSALVSPPPTLLIEDAQGRFLAEVGEYRRKGFWPLPETLPHRLVEATLAGEDARFFQHGGVDRRSACRALLQNLRSRRRVSGASTLAMQVARLQDPQGHRRGYGRKLQEALIARGLIRQFGHEGVLRHYLRIAPYGNQFHGAVYAARRYFRKPLEDLTWAESALLAALPRLPGRMSLLTSQGRTRAESRARWILGRLRRLGRIDLEEHRAALDLLPQLSMAPREIRPRSGLHAALAMEAALKNVPPSDPRHYRLRSTLNLDVQSMVQLQAWRAMEKYRPEGAGNVAAVVAEKSTGHILAYLGSEDYFDRENAGAFDYAQVARSSGSTLKPFIFAQGLWAKGYTAATLLTDVGMALNGRAGNYVIRNFDESFLGPILFRNALANSRNVPAVEVLEALGVDAVFQHLKELGLVRSPHPAQHFGAGLALGTLPVTLMDLVRAYGVLAQDGRSFDLRWFPGVPSPSKQLIPMEAARQITLFLSDPMARLPSFPRMGSLEYPFPVAVKTGTSQGFRDAWCLAYSEKYIVGAWIGHPRNYPMNRTSGASSAAELVHGILEHLHPEEMQGQNDRSFSPPQGWAAHRICMLSGKRATSDCPSVALEWFKPGTEPELEENVHVKLPVDTRTGQPATPDCPPALTRIQAYTVLDPRFAAWARQSGLEPLPPPTPSGSAQEPRLSITKPRPGTIFSDPETPLSHQTLALEAIVTPPVSQVVWYVDGKPFQVVDYPYALRWKMQSGTHTFQIRLPFAPLASSIIKIQVKP